MLPLVIKPILQTSNNYSSAMSYAVKCRLMHQNISIASQFVFSVTTTFMGDFST